MTQEEIQQGYHDDCIVDTNAPKHLQSPAYYTHNGWMQGVEWAKDKLIEEFAQYLDENIEPGLVIYNGGTWCSRDEFIKKMKEDFRK